VCGMSTGGAGSPSGRGGGRKDVLLAEDDRLPARVASSPCCTCASPNGEGEGGLEGGRIGIGVRVTGASKDVGVCVRSEGCTKGFSDVRVPVDASKLVLRSSREALGECTATSLDERVWSISSRGTTYPSRVMSTDLKVRVLPGPTEVPIEVRPERTRLAVRVTLEKREGPELYCTDSRTDFRRRRSASSQRLSVCSSPKRKRKKKNVSALGEHRGNRSGCSEHRSKK
jgi:hypothetical protein